MWSDGYVSEIEYTHGFYSELSPSMQQLACLSKGIKTRDFNSPNFKYLELGFGQGLAFNIHAATNIGSFWGTDFNPTQALNAQTLANCSNADAIAFDASFAEIAARKDLPEFDAISLHGIWSWISEENRATIVDIARKKLKPGGIMYVSYNVTPGWAPAMPLRHLMCEYAERQATGTIGSKIDAALEFCQSVADANSGYFIANPEVTKRLERIKKQDKSYLAHEYFNADWHPMPFSKVATMLADAKLDFATSAHLLDHVDEINLSEDAQSLIARISDPIMVQTTRDYFVNQQFRRDLFIKGGGAFSSHEINREIQNKSFMLLIHPDNIPSKTTSALGEVSLKKDIYGPLSAFLASDSYQPKRFNEICTSVECKELTANQVWQSLLVFCSMGVCAPAQDYKQAKSLSKNARGLNRELWRRAEWSANIGHIAAPLIGSAVSVNRFEQLFLLAMDKKIANPVQFVASILNSQGQRMIVDNKPLETDDEQIAELTSRLSEFEEKRLPIFKKLLII